jgi:hypothetical protein
MGMRKALLNLARTVKVSPEKGHSTPLVLGAVEGFNPIPVLSIRDQLLDDAMNLAVVFSTDKTVQRALMHQSFSGVGELMASRKVLANDTMKGNSTGSQHVM